jgi:hypothetical protein
MKLKFSKQNFEKKSQILTLIKILPVGAELFHADKQTDRRTDMTKLIVAFRSFADTPKTLYLWTYTGPQTESY